MRVCESIERVNGGYIVTIRFPFGHYGDHGKVVVATFDEVIELLRKSAGVNTPPVDGTPPTNEVP